MKISEVISALIKFHPPIDEGRTTDVVKFGDPEQECTGIVVTCFPSVGVIHEAAKRGANLIIAHEPLFWTHEDKTGWLAPSRNFAEKAKLLADSGIVVWRDHDHIHGGDPGHDLAHPDGIFWGIMRELGWEEYKLEYPNKPLVFRIPETDGETLGRFLIGKLGLNGLRVVGDKSAKISKVFLCEHIREGDPEEREKMLKTELEDVDALIALEIIDWTLAAFVRDSCALGRKKILYNAGHFNFEELGMKYMVKYLPRVAGDIPVSHVSSGDAFDFIV